TAFTTVMHAVTSQTVDMMLALLLILGGVIGAQIGTRVGMRLKAEQLRILLSLLVLTVAIRIGVGLVLTPDELYSLAPGILP
ncbi:MAG: TSUP family transporter, partial [Tabrizicola sp.]|nr:TSUP family transporter [Tabrizicola sp.]